ncbi:hypothetical protein [Rhizohabitans arisaemae]|uniref:hypothetical protein n=1 Tax=Rhizohabitans arisaemae TaxID=2720610 RepID=UPI0024B0B7ED|nr:hypothetical protein [Rhizohabitans arisaemae]
MSSPPAALFKTGWGRVAVRILLYLLALFVCWLGIGIAAGLNTGWQWLIVVPFAIALFLVPAALVAISERMYWHMWVSIAVCVVLFATGFTVPGDWYLRLFGERVTATVLSQEKTVDSDGATVYNYRLARPDGRPLAGRLESYEEYRLPADVLVTVDPLGVLSPRPRGGWASGVEVEVALVGFAVMAALAIVAGLKGETRRRALGPPVRRWPRPRDVFVSPAAEKPAPAPSAAARRKKPARLKSQKGKRPR